LNYTKSTLKPKCGLKDGQSRKGIGVSAQNGEINSQKRGEGVLQMGKKRELEPQSGRE